MAPRSSSTATKPRVLPQAIEAERALIGSVLVLGEVAGEISELVAASDFYKPAHQTIWQAILDVGQDQRVDAVTVLSWLQQHGFDDESTFGPAALLDLQNSTAVLSNGVAYAKEIAAARLRRDLVQVATQIVDTAHELPDAGAAADRARELIANLDLPTVAGRPDMDIDTLLDTVDLTYDWLIPGFLERGDRMLVTAGEGAGKSVLLTQIAVQAAAGVHPWTLQRCTPRNALIVDCENNERLLTRRLQQLRSYAPSDFEPLRLRAIARPEGLDLTSRADQLWLLDRCRANRAELLVIGPAYRLEAGVPDRGDIGGQERAKTVTNALDKCRIRLGISLVMETHAPHGGISGRDLRPFGSSVWLRWPEFGVGIRADREVHGRYLFEHWRGPRDVRVWPTALRRGGRWPWSAEMPTGTFNTPSDVRQDQLVADPSGDGTDRYPGDDL